MLSDAIEYPFEGDDVMERLLLGGALYLLWPLVVPGVLAGGYSVAVVRSVLAGQTEPPAFDDWEGLFRDGLSVLAISIVYSLPGLVLAGLGLGVFVVARLLGFAAFSGVVFVFLAGTGTLVGFAYGLAVSYLLPAALVNYARTDEVSAAWDVAALRSIVTRGEYATAWVAGTAVLLVANAVGGAVLFVLVGFAVFFYGQVAATYIFSRGTMAALGVEPEPSAPDSPDERTDESGDGVADPGDGVDDSAGRVDAGESDETAAPGDDGRALTDVDGVGPATAAALRDAGFESVAALRDASRKDLAGVDGIGPAKADWIKQDVGRD